MKWASLVHAVSALLIVGAVATWLGTGREGYTRLPDDRLARSDAPTSEAESVLLAEIGLGGGGDDGSVPDIQSRFAFGLVPGGLDAPHLVSVTAAVALAGVLSGLALWRRRAAPSQVIS